MTDNYRLFADVLRCARFLYVVYYVYKKTDCISLLSK